MKLTVSKVIFEFDDIGKRQIVYIRFADLTDYANVGEHNGNPNNRRWFVGWKEANKSAIYPLGWTDCNPNQSNAAGWIRELYEAPNFSDMKPQPSLFMKPDSKEEQLLNAFGKFQAAERNNAEEGYLTVAETLNLIGQEAYKQLLEQNHLKVAAGRVTTFKSKKGGTK